MRELRVEDALMYLDQVKIEFGDRPHIYNEFLDIMKTFKSQAIDTPGVIRRVASLFHGNKRLVLGFNTFLPEGYRIELPMDGSSWPVYREPGRAGVVAIAPPPGGIPMPVHQRPPPPGVPGMGGRGGGPQGIQPRGGPPPRMGGPMPGRGPGGGRGGPPPGMAGRGGPGPAFPGMNLKPPPGTQQQQAGSMGRGGLNPAHMSGRSLPGRPGPIPGGPPPGSAAASAPPGGLKAPPPQPGQVQMADSSKQPVEFDHAINYVTTIKKRFASHPEIYRKFLEILHTYQKEQRGIKEVLDEVSLLFADHADLLKEFTYFLPDQVQAQAKAQLDVAAQKAEERARAREEAAKATANAPTGATLKSKGQQLVLPPPPTTPGRFGSSSSTYSVQKKEPRVPSHVPKVPFGATKGRSEDREREIARGAVHGVVSFDPVRPPRRHELSTSQAAQLLGRPMSIPPTPMQPMASETAFFEHVKAHFLRRDLFPDKPIVNRKQTPYMEFIKCLHLYGAGIMNKDELIQLLRGLFIQGNTPKSGANAPTTSGSQAATQASMSLLSELEKVLVGRGPFAVQERNKALKSKYGGHPLRQYELDDTFAKCTPSYRGFPKDYVFPRATGEDENKTGEVSTINYECFCVAKDWHTDNKGEKYFKCPETYDGIKARCNIHEEVLARVESEMYEVDMAIECNASTMRVLEPVAEEAKRLSLQEERDGQPIGRLQYKLRNRALNSIHIGAIARIYGESGEEVLQHLLRNPLVVVPIVFERLKEKNDEWRKVKKDLNKEWKKTTNENFAGSLDAKSFVYKREIELSFTSDKLLEECHKAKSFAKHPTKIKRHPATNMILPDFHLMNPDPELALFQPHLCVLVSKNMPHADAADLLKAYFDSSDKKTSKDEERFQKLLNASIKPWFGLQATAPEKKLTAGQIVKTVVGDGQILSVTEGDTVRYLVKFEFGVGYVLPDAIQETMAHQPVNSDDAKLDASQLMSDDIQVLFGTEKMYLFMRLYILLVTMLYQAKSMADQTDKTDDYSHIISSLKHLLQRKVDDKTFEERTRKTVKDSYNILAIPPLLQKCAEALTKMVKEDCLESLAVCSQLKLKDLEQLRNLSLDMTEEATYRLQIQSSASQVFFSYLPVDVELELSNPLDNVVLNPLPSASVSADVKPSAVLEPAAKRSLETTAEDPATSKGDSTTVEPEPKRMKTEETRQPEPVAQESKPEDKPPMEESMKEDD